MKEWLISFAASLDIMGLRNGAIGINVSTASKAAQVWGILFLLYTGLKGKCQVRCLLESNDGSRQYEGPTPEAGNFLGKVI